MADNQNDIVKMLANLLKSKSSNKIIIAIVIAVIAFISKGNINFSQLGSATSPAEASQEEAAPQKPEQPIAVDEKPATATQTKPATQNSATASSSAQNAYIQLQNIELPVCGAKKRAKDHQIREFKNYTICYRESYEQAEWAAYLLTKEMLTKNSGRSNDFRPDPQIKTGSATLADYRGSGYSRGHLAPAADFAFDEQAVSETFFMSNMSPQTKEFNAGIWQELEIQVRTWAKKYGRVYVISGPVLEKSASEYKSIGKNKVAVPEYYYKAILAPAYKNNADKASPDDAKSVETIGFIMPNEQREDSFWNYSVSVDEIEERTSIDFFSLLDDETEEKCEKSINLDFWR